MAAFINNLCFIVINSKIFVNVELYDMYVEGNYKVYDKY